MYLLLIFVSEIKAQSYRDWGVGIENVYNIPIKGVGFGLRSHFNLSNKWFLSPQFSFYPSWNKVSESYYGANINYNLTSEKKWGLYISLGPYYNHWSNHSVSSFSEAKLVNFSIELGGGIYRDAGCFRPFFEYLANAKWWESNLSAGVNVFFGACVSGERGRDGYKCPAY